LGIVAGTVLFARALGEFATLMLAGNIPGQTQTIPVAIYFAVEAGDMKPQSGCLSYFSDGSHRRELFGFPAFCCS